MVVKEIISIPKGMLRRKFTAPTIPSYHVPETKVTELVFSSNDWRVCLIHAKDGAGKTTLLAQWYEELVAKDNCIPIWISLEDRDTFAPSFARVLSAAFQQISEEFAKLTSEFVTEDDAHSMMVDIVNLLDESSDPNITYYLIFDDYSSAISPDLDAALLFLNKNLSENFKIIVAGTYLSSQLDDLLLDSSVLEFRSHDLVFNEDRLQQLARNLMPDLQENEYAFLFEMFDGWPLAYVFASLANKRAIDSDEATRIIDSYLQRYFSKEVLDTVNDVLHAFLVKVSLLDSMPVELCNQITGSIDAQSVFSELAAHNCYIEQTGRHSFTFDPLFRSVLRSELINVYRRQISHMAVMASEWYGKKKKFAQEVKFTAISCDSAFLEDMVFYATGTKYPKHYSSILDYMFEQPASRFLEEPYLIWISIWAFIASGKVESARRMMEKLPHVSSESFEHAMQYADALCLALEGNTEASYKAVKNLLDSQKGELPSEFACLFFHMEGEDCERLGKINESRDLYMRALSHAERMDGSFYKLFDMYLLSRHYLGYDDFDKVLEFAARIIEEVDEWDMFKASAYATMAYVCIERGQYEQAAEYLAHTHEDAYGVSNLDLQIDTAIAQARFDWATGNKIEALTVVQQLGLQILSKDNKVPRNVQYDLYSLIVKFSSMQEDLAVAHMFLDQIEQGSTLPDIFRAIPCMISLAIYKWSTGDAQGAHKEFDKVRKRIETSEIKGSYWLAETYILESAYYVEEGKRAQSVSLLGRAIELAIHNGYLTVFINGGYHIKTLLLELVTNRKTSSPIKAYARNVLSLFGDDADINEDIAFRSGDVTGYYSLTEREREILHLLNSGMSRQELSERLVISQNTAKTHLKNIYAKLGVHTRAEAYRASREYDDPNVSESISPTSPSE